MSLRILYVGGSGEISLACVRESIRAGHQVAVFNRGKTVGVIAPGVEQIIGDFADDTTYAALGTREFDVVCQFLVYDPERADRDIDVFSGRCEQYIFISSASAYRKPIPGPLIDEDTPLGNPFWAYSRSKAACEARLAKAQDAGRLPLTIVRPSHTYRERLPSPVISGDHLAWRLLEGKPVIVPGDGESVWTLTHADDFARAFVALFGNSQAIGERFNITDKVGHTWNAIVRIVAKAIGVEADIRGVLSRTLVQYEPRWEGPLLGDKANTMIFDTTKISRATDGWRCEIPLEDGVAGAWRSAQSRLKAGYVVDGAVDALIDKIIEDGRV